MVCHVQVVLPAVDLEQCMAVVEYEAPATVEQLESAVKEAGFTVEK